MATSADSITQAVSGITDWRPAVDALIAHIIEEGECFSSGEIARHLRYVNPALMFSVPGIGEYIRDLFYAGSMPEYEIDDGYGTIDNMPVSQVSRLTQGLHPARTPAGLNVFVYCPDSTDGDNHDFEVYIPKPGETAETEPQPVPPSQLPVTAPAATPASSAPSGKTPVSIQGNASALSASDYKAAVNSENRLCVTRQAFEACVHMGGRPMKGGEPIFISFVDDEVNISQTPIGAKDEGAYSLATERGRVLFTAQDPANPFVPGTVYTLKIGPGIIKVDLLSAVAPATATPAAV
jgi:hypothetical protein